jgi:hypothetical protein
MQEELVSDKGLLIWAAAHLFHLRLLSSPFSYTLEIQQTHYEGRQLQQLNSRDHSHVIRKGVTLATGTAEMEDAILDVNYGLMKLCMPPSKQWIMER